MMLRIEFSGALNRAQPFLLESNANALEFILEKAIIETYIVRTQYRLIEPLQQCFAHLRESRRMVDHALSDSRQPLNEG